MPPTKVSLYSLFAILLVAGEQHHVAHTFVQFVDVVHQYLEFHGSSCRSRSHFYLFSNGGAKVRQITKVRNT
jgi:hypothetical protein